MTRNKAQTLSQITFRDIIGSGDKVRAEAAALQLEDQIMDARFRGDHTTANALQEQQDALWALADGITTY